MDRISRSDEDAFKNQHKVQDYHYVRGSIRQSGDEKSPQDKKFIAKGSNGEEDESEEVVPRDEESWYASAGGGLCVVCNLAVGGPVVPGGNASFEQAMSCDQGHLLCQRCVQRFAIRSDMGCVLCRTTSQHSNSTGSRGSSGSLSRVRIAEDEKPTECNWARPEAPCPPYQSGVKYRSSNWEASEFRDGESRQHQQRSYCSLVRKEPMLDPSASETRVNGQIVTECSRRPIRCPRLDCAVNVAFSALTHHFLFDHPEVPILSVEPGAKSTLIVSFAALQCDSSRCLALLLVSGKLSGPASRLFNGSQIHPKYRNRLPLPVLAARLHCSSRSSPDAGGEGHGGDVIIAWVAGLDIGNVNAGSLRCSIQAVDNVEGESVRSLTYTGPVNSLRTAQRPREVFLSGDCVILHEGLVNHITSDCSSLNVNVTVH